VRPRPWIRATLGASTVVILATLARADAPQTQYNLFNNNSDVIQDLQTGLYWQRYPSAAELSFDAAAAYCGQVSLDTLTSGWRVPSYKELQTLVDESPHYEYENGQLVEKWIDGNAFLGALASPVLMADYWTSSAYPVLPAGYAYTVNFNTGVGHSQSMPSSQYVRCVH
jgi:hypothetical protein